MKNQLVISALLGLTQVQAGLPMLGAPAPMETKQRLTLAPPQMTSGVSMTTGMMRIGSELPSMGMMSGGSSMQSSGGSSTHTSMQSSGGSSMQSSGGSSTHTSMTMGGSSMQSMGGSSMQSSDTQTSTGNKHSMVMSAGGLPMPMSIPGSSGPMIQTSIRSETSISPPVKVTIVKDKKDESKNGSIFSDAEAKCYWSRYKDVKKNQLLSYYDTLWSGGHELEGRVEDCALPLTDFESQQYLNVFPELQQKFGRGGKKAIEQAKDHWSTIGWSDSKYKAAVSYKQKAWKCGDAPNVECKCHGTLWLGASNRLDNGKPISKWEDFRLFAMLEKTGIDPGTPTMCNGIAFGKDPLPGKTQACWCEDKPLYEPNDCGDDGENCMCNGFILFGTKVDKNKKKLKFIDVIQQPFVLATMKEGQTGMKCQEESFNGVDPNFDGEKSCWCDQEKKYFTEEQTMAVATYWKSQQTEREGKEELESTQLQKSKIETEYTTKVVEFTKELEEEELEKTVTLRQLEESKKCIEQAKEAAEKFRKIQMTRIQMERKKRIEIKEQQIKKWNVDMTMKHKASLEACSLATRSKTDQEKQKLMEECTRLRGDVRLVTTTIKIEQSKIDEEVTTEEIREKEETETEITETYKKEEFQKKETEETKAVLEEKSTETKQIIVTEKQTLTKKKLELQKLQERTEFEIQQSIIQKRSAILIMITKEKELVMKLEIEEENDADDDDDEDEVKVVSIKIVKRAKSCVKHVETRVVKYTKQVTKVSKSISTYNTKVTTIRKRIVDLRQVLEQRSEEVLEMTKTLKSKQEFFSKNPGQVTTIKEIETIQQKITKSETIIKTSRTEYVTVTSEEVSITKLVEFYSTQKTEFTKTITITSEEGEGCKQTVIEQSEKIQTSTTIKKIVTIQKKSFESHQTLVKTETSIETIRKERDEKMSSWTTEETVKKRELEEQKSKFDQYTSQKTTLESLLKSTKSQTEVERISRELSTVTSKITTYTKTVTQIEYRIKWLTRSVTSWTTTYKKQITDLTVKWKQYKKETVKIDQQAKEVVKEMPSAPEEPPAPVELPPTPLPKIVIPKIVIETKTKKEEPPKAPLPPVVIDKPAPVSPPVPKPTPPPKPVVDKKTVKEKKISKKEIGQSSTTTNTSTETSTKTVVSTATTTIMRTITTIDGSSVEIAIPPPKMPALNDLPDIGNEVKEKTEAAKQKRVECAKASAKLAGHKDIIDKTVKELKDETGKKQAKLKECRTETDALRSSISTEMNALMASGADKQKQSDLKKKIKVLELKLEEVNGKCEADDFDEKKGEKIISDKIAEIKTIVRFIKETCADAAEGESEVEDAIMMVSQIEYTNRVYIQYMQFMQKLEQQEKIFENNQEIYEKRRKSNMVIILENQRQEEEYRKNVEIMRAKLITMQTSTATSTETSTTTTTTSQTEVINTLKSSITQQETKWTSTVTIRESVEKQMTTMQSRFETIITQTNNVRRHTERIKKTYTTTQTTLKRTVETSTRKAESRKKIIKSVKVLDKKITTITKVVTEIKLEIEVQRKRMTQITVEIEGCMKKTTVAVETMTALTVKQTEIQTTLKSSKDGKQMETAKSELQRITSELETTKNVQVTEENICKKLKEEVVVVTSKVQKFEVEFTSYTSILVKTEISYKESSLTVVTLIPAAKPEIPEVDDVPEVPTLKPTPPKPEPKDVPKSLEPKVTPPKPASQPPKRPVISPEIKTIENEKTVVITKTELLEREVEESETIITESVESTSTKTSIKVSQDKEEETEIREEEEIIERTRERQKCAVLFPKIFGSFTKSNTMEKAGMCPCQGSATGVSQIVLQVTKVEDANHIVNDLFKSKKIIEATFQQRLQKTWINESGKLIVEGEGDVITLTLTTDTASVSSILDKLENGKVAQKGEATVAPLSTGKVGYMKWVSDTLTSQRK